VVTWDFLPDQIQTSLVLQFREAGFKLIWFDGNRPAALRAFQKRATVPEESFYLQMNGIEASKVIESIEPVIINPFNEDQQFKPAGELLEEISRA
jgi:hypothetical protein